MKQKGGLILPYKDTKKSEEIFMRYLENSDIKKLTSGAYGLTYVSKLRNDESMTGDEYKTISPDASNGSKVNSLLIKISIITEYSDEEILLGSSIELRTVEEESFKDEINIQTDIYLKTLGYLQPLCPGIVYAKILNNIEGSALLEKMIENIKDEKSRELIKNLKFGIGINEEIKLGIIGMEFLETGDTLFNKSYDADIESKLHYNNYVRYVLLKLALETGYNHGDFHKGNIMLIPSSNYIYGESERVIIIDFGKAKKLSPETIQKIKNDVENRNYVVALKELCLIKNSNDVVINPRYRDYYGYVCMNYNLTNPEYEMELVKKLGPEYEGHIRQMVINNMKNNVAMGYNMSGSELADNINNELHRLFQNREKQIDINIKVMEKLHEENRERYPLLPVSNALKNELYNGMIGGSGRKTKRNVKRSGGRGRGRGRGGSRGRGGRGGGSRRRRQGENYKKLVE